LGDLVPTAKLRKVGTVLVLSAGGGLGVIAAQIAKAVGAKVIGMVGDKEKAKIVRGLGADEVVGYNLFRWEGRAKELTEGGEGVDMVYDAVAQI